MLLNREFDIPNKPIPESSERQIYDELGELAKYVEATTRAIREMELPLSTTADQLPQANDFLVDLSRMTEEGTHRVITLTEAIEANRAKISATLKDVQVLLSEGRDSARARERVGQAMDMLNQDESRLLDISVVRY